MFESKDTSRQFTPVTPDGIGEPRTPIHGLSADEYRAAVHKSELEGTTAAIQEQRARKVARQALFNGFRRKRS